MPPRSLATPRLDPVPLSPGQSLWLCLPPGGALRAVHGAVTVRRAPQVCGHIVHTPAPTVLEAGEPPMRSDSAQSTWVHVHNLTRAAAEIQLAAAAPAPALWPRVWQTLQATVRRSGQAARDPRYPLDAGGAAH